MISSVLKYFPELSDTQITQFEKLAISFPEWNAKINLVSRKDIDGFQERHLLHSLAIYKAMKFAPESRILDVGTGGGLPGIPLAILMPDVDFILCDSTGKKIMVVNELISELGLTNVRGIHARASDVPGKFDFVISRAVTRLSKFIPWVENKIGKRSINPWPNGILYLKGGDLQAELEELNFPTEVLPIAEWFSEEYFETKAVVYVTL
ncbi:MAG TPA: 16S rRNA (guanine(527)-N(7))-methyltransferase RsmG [Flavobacteriales bacterium]|jgi:16S rRNA (guanine527-N7)-methyltransferase|nr:16S rRNA (guanine(527)-N(7))-methyltransferase RsmG [Flavobacteriales bacterium]HIB77239.1 16S rRNA (guanine(527)-N(7))-methyltransferase RsmG [Flavobacteriales bacterium]HIN41818.1 16S rRNA (guanine(527)-N(7))-methyltransferase RsmG [Flavobacteriales bacterium]HIO16409.1 16S rRNA (guanine(527)-N(7))-methyltransferase RsmG [Flavobacteriales bacterium]HIO59817.1 16S rRNA (guanine(527)-N(7))-methyltransferase RsmG [Flavobacteriales bacterium]